MLRSSRFGMQNRTDGKRYSSKSILGPRKRGLWQKRRRACLNLPAIGSPRHRNTGGTGARNASLPIGSLLTPNGRGKGWFTEGFPLRKYQLYRWHTKRELALRGSQSRGYSGGIRSVLQTNGGCACFFLGWLISGRESQDYWRLLEYWA